MMPPHHVPDSPTWAYLRTLVGAALLALLALPLVGLTAGEPSAGADAGIIDTAKRRSVSKIPTDFIGRRQSSNVCKRWSQQSAIVNGTMYVYGGHASNSPSQKTDTWTNDFLSIDLTQSWDISSPSSNSLPQPSGPPAVSNGYLWASYDSVFLYGGEFSDSPVTTPTQYSLWEYSVAGSSWQEHSNPQTSAGQNAADSNQPVQRAAEGAGAYVAGLGRGWYFGGHLDGYTTQGWSQSVPRVYLKSLLEYTFPRSANDAVQSLSSGQVAGSDGAWRNITEAQGNAGFPERADGVLLWIPGFSKQGILVGLGGGTSDQFAQMNVIDVFDIATSTWFKQSTQGPTPNIRVNPCAVVVAAADGSSYQIHMYGGQNLQPAGAQIQYNDMWILTVPAFIWIGPLDMSGQSQPAARAGHTCNVWDGQMVVVGGYVGQSLACDSPGVYSFNLSSLQWSQSFQPTSERKSNPLSRQEAQIDAQGQDSVDGSHGYEVPENVRGVIGGGPSGGATLTTPAATAFSGPLATGQAQTYTVTAGAPGATGGSGSSDGTNDTGRKVAIGVGVAAGVIFLVAIYLGVCAIIYRRRLKLYQQHMEAERAAREAGGGAYGFYGQSPEAKANQPAINRAGSPDPRGLGNMEPTFVGIMLHPRKSLKVVNP